MCIKTIGIKKHQRDITVKQAKYPLLLRNTKFVLQPIEILELVQDEFNLLIVIIFPFLQQSLFDK